MASDVKVLAVDKDSLQISESEGYRLPPLWRDYTDSNGEIFSDRSTSFKFLLSIAIIFLAISFPIGTQIRFGYPRDDLFVHLYRGICPAVGVLFLLFSIRSYVWIKKFGKTTFSIKNNIGKLGGTLEGILTTTVNLEPKSDYTVSLECIRTVVPAGSISKGRQIILWKGMNKISKFNYKSTTGIPISFLIPLDLPQSNKISGEGRIQWLLRFIAPTRGIKYSTNFVVPVFHSR